MSSADPLLANPAGRYRAYGLEIQSELPLPELQRGTGPAEILIRRGVLADCPDQGKLYGWTFNAAPGFLRMRIPGTVSFSIEQGRTITVDQAEGSADDLVRLLTLDTAMGCLLAQRGEFVLHGGSARTPRGAVLFLGETASGKSSVAAALHRRGIPILTEEICRLGFPEGGASPLVVPSYPRIQVWPDAVSSLGLDPSTFEPVCGQLGKISIRTERGFDGRPVPVHKVIILAIGDVNKVVVTPLDKTESIETLLTHTHRRQFVEAFGFAGTHLERCVRLALSTPFVKVVRPAVSGQLEQLTGIVQEEMGL